MIKGREVSYLTDLAIVGEDGGVGFRGDEVVIRSVCSKIAQLANNCLCNQPYQILLLLSSPPNQSTINPSTHQSRTFFSYATCCFEYLQAQESD